MYEVVFIISDTIILVVWFDYYFYLVAKAFILQLQRATKTRADCLESCFQEGVDHIPKKWDIVPLQAEMLHPPQNQAEILS